MVTFRKLLRATRLTRLCGILAGFRSFLQILSIFHFDFRNMSLVAIPMLWGLGGQGIELRHLENYNDYQTCQMQAKFTIIKSNCHFNVLKYRIFVAKVVVNPNLQV